MVVFRRIIFFCNLDPNGKIIPRYFSIKIQFTLLSYSLILGKVRLVPYKDADHRIAIESRRKWVVRLEDSKLSTCAVYLCGCPITKEEGGGHPPVLRNEKEVATRYRMYSARHLPCLSIQFKKMPLHIFTFLSSAKKEKRGAQGPSLEAAWQFFFKTKLYVNDSLERRQQH